MLSVSKIDALSLWLITMILQSDQDITYMQEALKLAKRALRYDEVPIGAVVIDADGSIIGRGYNRVEKRKTQVAHAEMIALLQAAQKRGDWRLDGCWLYVTLEPCLMCMGLVRLSRLAGVVFGAPSPLFGFRLDNTADAAVYKRGVFPIVKQGVCEEQAAFLLRQFFQKKRKRSKG